MESVSSTQY